MLEIFVGTQRITQFANFTLQRSVDSIGANFSFTTPFYPNVKIYRDLFRPFAYPVVTIKINNVLVFTGVLEAISPQLGSSFNTVVLQGRSKASVLVDCTFEKSDFPVQFSQAKLDEISNSVAKKYGISSVFADEIGPLFEEAGPQSPTETVFVFLQNLARQRKLLISEDVNGNLLYRKANVTGKPVAVLKEGDRGVVVSAATYDGQQRFSSFDTFGQEPGKTDNFSRTLDPALTGVIRPKALQANDTNNGNIEDVSKWAATAAVANSIRIPLGLVGWQTPDGDLWEENQIINLTAPSLMIYKPFPFLVTSVTLNETDKDHTASVDLTIPGAYSGTLPKGYPWDD